MFEKIKNLKGLRRLHDGFFRKTTNNKGPISIQKKIKWKTYIILRWKIGTQN